MQNSNLYTKLRNDLDSVTRCDVPHRVTQTTNFSTRCVAYKVFCNQLQKVNVFQMQSVWTVFMYAPKIGSLIELIWRQGNSMLKYFNRWVTHFLGINGLSFIGLNDIIHPPGFSAKIFFMLQPQKIEHRLLIMRSICGCVSNPHKLI